VHFANAAPNFSTGLVRPDMVGILAGCRRLHVYSFRSRRSRVLRRILEYSTIGTFGIGVESAREISTSRVLNHDVHDDPHSKAQHLDWMKLEAVTDARRSPRAPRANHRASEFRYFVSGRSELYGFTTSPAAGVVSYLPLNSRINCFAACSGRHLEPSLHP